MEWLDIVDEHGVPTGEVVERTFAHASGVLHRTAHVWLLRDRGRGTEVLLQKRSHDKDSHPGCYDISSAGHIPAGVDYLSSAVRELKEELGLEAREEEFHYCGQRRIHWEEMFHGEDFVDNQVSNVYYLWKDVEPSSLVLQETEVEEVRWMDLKQCKKAVAEHSFPNCIALEELELLPKRYEVPKRHEV
ncbi:NUDIX domain-containing protein [Blautia schinkii]|nr:NUDIX domain-containing protein [Blautia schinkii]